MIRELPASFGRCVLCSVVVEVDVDFVLGRGGTVGAAGAVVLAGADGVFSVGPSRRRERILSPPRVR